jgi:hypothetical protein
MLVIDTGGDSEFDIFISLLARCGKSGFKTKLGSPKKLVIVETQADRLK